MSREQLEKFALNLRNEVEREREERNYFQLERDQLRQFWEITKNQLGKYRLNLFLLIFFRQRIPQFTFRKNGF